MASLPRDQSRAITTYSHLSSNLHLHSPEYFQLKQFWLKKSLFNPPPGLAEAFAARRHLAGVEVPRIQIIYCSSRWLLLQARQAKTSFFEDLKAGKLGNRDQQLLKLFKSFVALIKPYGFFCPAQKMIFIEGKELRVWINEDVFSHTPQLPINQGKDSEKHFIQAFFSMVQTSLQDWQKISNVVTIQQTIKALQWRWKLARGSRTAVNASQYANFKPQQSHASFNQSQLGNLDNIISSQQLEYHTVLDDNRPTLSNSSILNEANVFYKAKVVRFGSNVEFQITQAADEENLVRHTKKKFALHSTSSTLGNFIEKFRSTFGGKKLLEKSQNLQERSPANFPNIQAQFLDLFPEGIELQKEYDEEQLQRIAQQIQEVLIW